VAPAPDRNSAGARLWRRSKSRGRAAVMWPQMSALASQARSRVSASLVQTAAALICNEAAERLSRRHALRSHADIRPARFVVGRGAQRQAVGSAKDAAGRAVAWTDCAVARRRPGRRAAGVAAGNSQPRRRSGSHPHRGVRTGSARRSRIRRHALQRQLCAADVAGAPRRYPADHVPQSFGRSSTGR
jgi:hypothetical protein